MLRRKFIVLLLMLMAGSIWYWQYRQYRLPVELSAIEGSFVNQLVSGGIPPNGIPPLDDPLYESVVMADQYLKDDGLGLDVASGGYHRFYPYQILVYHEIVNLTWRGQPLLITYSPLTSSGIVLDRGDHLFSNAGQLWNSNLVMYDRATGSLWSQLLGQAMSGDLAGERLTMRSSTVMSWQDWKRQYPDGQVLSKETGFDRDYTRDPYGNYYETAAVWFPVLHEDGRRPFKELVYGLASDGHYLAYPRDKFSGGVPAVLTYWFAWAAAYPETEIVE